MRNVKKLTPFGKVVKKRLVDLDMNQRDLARLIGTSGAQVTYLLYGERNADKWVVPICTALGITNYAEHQRGA